MTKSHEETRLAKGEYDNIFNNVLASLQEIGLSITEEDASEGHIKAKLHSSIYSIWGIGGTGFINVWFKKVDTGVELRVKSQSLPTVLLDWGKNKKNVNKILEALDKRIELE
jgi:hypothetical protein